MCLIYENYSKQKSFSHFENFWVQKITDEHEETQQKQKYNWWVETNSNLDILKMEIFHSAIFLNFLSCIEWIL